MKEQLQQDKITFIASYLKREVVCYLKEAGLYDVYIDNMLIQRNASYKWILSFRYLLMNNEI